MSLVVNHNLMAANTARNLNAHYGNLSVSTQRLSTGLRVNSAADDAAGLAIRELQRADISALQQGSRNANDAISLIQTADGALGVIDEKLIRMKELAEQAATGTYDSTQRLMIDSEFQAMASEIDRIANATDFNGIHLLDGSLNGAHDGSGLNSPGAMKIHFGSSNDSAEDYYYIDIGNCTTAGLGLTGNYKRTQTIVFEDLWAGDPVTNDPDTQTITLNITNRTSSYGSAYDSIARTTITWDSPAKAGDIIGFDYYALPTGLTDVTITSNTGIDDNGNYYHPTHKAHVCLFTSDGIQITGPPVSGSWTYIKSSDGTTDTTSTGVWWNNHSGDAILTAGKTLGVFNETVSSLDYTSTITNEGDFYIGDGYTVTMLTDQNEIGARRVKTENPTDEQIYIDVITNDLVFLIGGHNTPENPNYCNTYSLTITAKVNDEFLEKHKATIKNDIVRTDGGLISIATQDNAQQALVRINDAIVAKDKVRAHLGALQNRFENTITNLNIQAENLQNAESRISDVDVATEMTQFVRNQILSQSAVAMLSQANSLPQMAASIIQG